MLCCGGKKVPTETHYQGELTKFLSEVRRGQREEKKACMVRVF